MVADLKRRAQGRRLNPLPRTLINRRLARDDVDLYESNRRWIECPECPNPIGLEVGYVERIVAVKVINHAVGDPRIDRGVTPVARIGELQVFHAIHERGSDWRSRAAIHCARQTGTRRATVGYPVAT